MKKVLVFLFLLLSLKVFSQVRNSEDYLGILVKGSYYDFTDTLPIPSFTYQSSMDSNLKQVRRNLHLDSIAGKGDQLSQSRRIMKWLHDLVKHNGQIESGIKRINVLEVIDFAKSKGRGVSCGELASALNDCYLSMGWKSRKVYCFPKDSLKQDRDSHVINIVWIESLKKWIWMDPTNNAYVVDEYNMPLSIEEVRYRLINKLPLKINQDANWNGTPVVDDYYLYKYMAKNLYRFYSPLHSGMNYENFWENNHVTYVNLVPLDWHKKFPRKTDIYINEDVKTIFDNYFIYNPILFWRK